MNSAAVYKGWVVGLGELCSKTVLYSNALNWFHYASENCLL